MRGFVPIVLAGAAAMLLPASAQVSDASRIVGPVVCRGEASGVQGEGLTVSVNVSSAGARTSSISSWQPPILTAQGLAKPDLPEQPGLSLSLIYEGSSAKSVGSLQRATAIISFFSPLRKQESRKTLENRAERLTAGVSFDGTPVIPLQLVRPTDGMADLPGITARIATLAFSTSPPRETTIFFYDRKGKVVASVRFATGSNASRDRLFAQAWAQADQAVSNPALCEPD